jgi:branched-chain amino acid transport system substrate-binding protein
LASAQAFALPTIRLATISPLTGPQAEAGLKVKFGAEVAIKEAMSEFKELGYDLALESYDDIATPSIGSTIAKNIVLNKEVIGVIGTLNSFVAIPILNIFSQYDVPMISPANLYDPLTAKGWANYNRVVPYDSLQIKGMSDFIIKQLKPRSAYILCDKTAYSCGAATAIIAALKKSGVTQEMENFAVLNIKIKALKPEIIFFSGLYNQLGVFIKQVRNYGFQSPILALDGALSNELFKNIDSDAKNIFISDLIPNGILPASQNIPDDFKDKDLKTSISSYDATKIFLLSIKSYINANNRLPERKELSELIRKQRYSGLTGVIKFNVFGDRMESSIPIYEVKNGKFEPFTSIPVKAEIPSQLQDLNCKNFTSQKTAQALYDALGGLSNDRFRLDADNDGIACEELP